MEENEHQRIIELADRCAKMLRQDPMKGVERLYEELGNDALMVKSILAVTAMQHHDLSEFIHDYLRVDRQLQNKDPRWEEQQKNFQMVRKLINTLMELFSERLYQGEITGAEETINEITTVLEDHLHNYYVKTNADKLSKPDQAFEQIKNLQRRLNRISDFIQIDNKDKLLNDMAKLQAEMRELEASIQGILLI